MNNSLVLRGHIHIRAALAVLVIGHLDISHVEGTGERAAVLAIDNVSPRPAPNSPGNLTRPISAELLKLHDVADGREAVICVRDGLRDEYQVTGREPGAAGKCVH